MLHFPCRCFRVIPCLLITAFFAGPVGRSAAEWPSFSGRYPHLAAYNSSGECGIGAVVPWADRLWFITYAPHMPGGSDDKLYEIDSGLNVTIRPESIGGTPANRMIHRESNQLFIGPYAIDAQRNVRAIPYATMYGRHTSTARHLTEPARKVFYFDMEGLLYEVDVKTLEAKLLFRRAVPGWHAKGAYTSQGRFVVANNGEHAAGTVDRFKPFEYQIDPARTSPEDAGVLAEWDGDQWRLIRRRQFTEVTGPGGIYGPPSDTSPLWAMGWDKRSLMLMLLDGGVWHEFRLPKADYSYDGQHGWHTEWPRIREVVPAADGQPPKLLANKHGGWFDFPPGFRADDTSGLRPIGSYLKITGDFTGYDGRIVFACDDAGDMVDGYIAKRHTLPLSATPRLLVRLSAAIARYDLYLGGDRQPTEQVKTDRDHAIAFLRDVAMGKADLGLDAAGAEPAEDGGGVVVAKGEPRNVTADDLSHYFGGWRG